MPMQISDSSAFKYGFDSTSRDEKIVGCSFLISNAGIMTFVNVSFNSVVPSFCSTRARRYFPLYVGPDIALKSFIAGAKGPLHCGKILGQCSR